MASHNSKASAVASMAGDAEFVGDHRDGPKGHGSKQEKHRENEGSTVKGLDGRLDEGE